MFFAVLRRDAKVVFGEEHGSRWISWAYDNEL
jgi:hypothetical protein